MHFFGTLGTCPLSVFGRSMRVCVCVSVAPSTEFAYDVRCTHVLQTPRVCHAPVAGCCVCPMHVTLHGHFGIGNEQQANDDAKWKHVQQNKTFFIKSVRSENCHMPLLRGTCECVCGDVIVVAVLFFFSSSYAALFSVVVAGFCSIYGLNDDVRWPSSAANAFFVVVVAILVASFCMWICECDTVFWAENIA